MSNTVGMLDIISTFIKQKLFLNLTAFQFDFLEDIAIHLNCEVIVNEKNYFTMLSTAWKNLFSANNYFSLNSGN